MGKTHEKITAKMAEFIKASPVYFVATAPTSTAHRVNVSPRAPGASCIVTGALEVHWGDLSGSGAETAAHVLENGRMTLLFVNLQEGAPYILRLHGVAKILLPGECDEKLLAQLPSEMPSSNAFRCVYRLQVQRVSTSCGYSMPVMKFDHFRSTLYEKSAAMDMDAYRDLKNTFSIDGLPSLMHLDPKAEGRQPSLEDGYVFAKPINALDLQAKAQAKARRQTLVASPARAGLLDAARPASSQEEGTLYPTTKINPSRALDSLLTLVPLLLAFGFGFLACLAVQAT